MNVLSLFSGIGGLELGLERAGMTCVGQIEIDPFCRRVLDRHWPEVPRHDDVRTAVGWWLAEPRPDVDLIAGGFPCQGHSVAGRRRGTDDERWGWPAFRDVVEALGPPFVLVENVPNLTRTGLIDVLADLARLGFDAWWSRVPAAAVGAPHLRWRLFLIAAHAARTGFDERAWIDAIDQLVTGYDGATWAMADAEREPGRAWRARDAGQGAGGRDADRGGVGATLADASGAGRWEGWGTRPGGSPGETGRPDERIQSERHGGWPTEPDVGRVAHGVPGRVDRLRVLGNAVVPAVGEYVGRLILAGVGHG